MEICENCSYFSVFYVVSKCGYEGQCFRYPPSGNIHHEDLYEFPNVLKKCSCGEFKKKDVQEIKI